MIIASFGAAFENNGRSYHPILKGEKIGLLKLFRLAPVMDAVKHNAAKR
jgi:hypothetical protein